MSNSDQNDHDLLVRIDEQIRNLISELKDSNRRLSDVEHNKVDIKTFEQHRNEKIETLKEFDFRITSNEKKIWIATGVLLVIQFILTFFGAKILNLI